MRTAVFTIRNRLNTPPTGLVAWLVRCLLLGLLAIVSVMAIVIAIPLAVLALAVGVIVWVVGSVRRAVLRAQAPNGATDGRKNVRVIQRRESGPV